jgi:hypothetical protein
MDTLDEALQGSTTDNGSAVEGHDGLVTHWW